MQAEMITGSVPTPFGGRFKKSITVKTASGGNAGSRPMGDDSMPPDYLGFARHAGGSSIYVRFADGLADTIDLKEQLGIKTDQLKLATACASHLGTALEIKDRRGRTVPIQGATLRAACDPVYAAQSRQAFDDAYADALRELHRPADGKPLPVRRLPAAKQRRLDVLGEKNNEGTLTSKEWAEYRALVREVEQLTAENAGRRTGQK